MALCAVVGITIREMLLALCSVVDITIRGDVIGTLFSGKQWITETSQSGETLLALCAVVNHGSLRHDNQGRPYWHFVQR